MAGFAKIILQSFIFQKMVFGCNNTLYVKKCCRRIFLAFLRWEQKLVIVIDNYY